LQEEVDGRGSSRRHSKITNTAKSSEEDVPKEESGWVGERECIQWRRENDGDEIGRVKNNREEDAKKF